MWGPVGTFSPDCLESLTPEPYTSGVHLFQCGPLRTGHGAGGGLDVWEKSRLRCPSFSQ